MVARIESLNLSNHQSSGENQNLNPIVPLVVTEDNSLEVFSGEEINFNVSGGVGTIVANDAGSGFLNSILYKYEVPIIVAPTQEKIKFQDSIG